MRRCEPWCAIPLPGHGGECETFEAWSARTGLRAIVDTDVPPRGLSPEELRDWARQALIDDEPRYREEQRQRLLADMRSEYGAFGCIFVRRVG